MTSVRSTHRMGTRSRTHPHGHERAELAVFRKFVRAPLNLELAR